jgi:hypothetical protein
METLAGRDEAVEIFDVFRLFALQKRFGNLYCCHSVTYRAVTRFRPPSRFGA